MNIKAFIRWECSKKGLTIEALAIDKLNFKSRQALYHHINKKTPSVLSQIESVLELPTGTLIDIN